MKISRTLINIMVVLGLVISGSRVWAGCSTNGFYTAGYTLNNTALTLPMNKMPGTAIGIAGSRTSGSNMINTTCLHNIKYYAKYSAASGMTEPDNYAGMGIFKTNIPGIGVKVFNGSYAVGNDIGESYKSATVASTIYGGGTIGLTVQLFITGPVSVTATNNKVQLLNKQIELWVNDIDGGISPGGARVGTMTFSVTSGVITVASCKTPNVTVPLGSHSASDFATVGATSAPVAFNIVVNECSKNMASVSYTLKPAAGISLVTKPFGQYLTLDSSSVASGVGVQVLKADGVTPVEFEHKYAATGYNPTAGNNFTIPLHARYIRTGTVSAGSANSAAEFVMSYE